MTQFKNRAYGFVSVKAINSNYNADFSGAPRTLPNGQVYATDKALKYTVRNFIKDVHPDQTVLYFKRLNDDMNPLSLADTYVTVFPEHKDLDAKKKDTKSIVIKDILSCVDVRLFGSTFAKKAKGGNIALSIHGPVQINHGVNIWGEGNIFAEQITSPFNSKEDSSNEQGTQVLSQNDIELLKEALRKGVTYYDSAAKAGCENEILFYVQLNENSRLVLPNFTEMVKMTNSKEGGKRYFDLSDIAAELEKHSAEIETCEIYYNPQTTVVENLPANCDVNQL